MNTSRKFSRVTGWISRSALALLAPVFCASAWAADPGKNVASVAKAPPSAATRPAAKKQIYVFTSASAIPQPVNRIATPIPTTAIPVTIIVNRLGN